MIGQAYNNNRQGVYTQRGREAWSDRGRGAWSDRGRTANMRNSLQQGDQRVRETKNKEAGKGIEGREN